MIIMRPGEKRGTTHIDWLDSRHTFSFGSYADPHYTGYRNLRVINDDRVAPGGGFDTHPHRDMEILTYVYEGALAHKDSLGTGSTIKPGELQCMSAGTGIRHSEFNPSSQEAVKFLQIWIVPKEQGLPPSYEQTSFSTTAVQNKLCLIGTMQGSGQPTTDNASVKPVTIHQDVNLFTAKLDAGVEVSHNLSSMRHAWLQIVRGAVTFNGKPMVAGDGAAIHSEPTLKIKAEQGAEFLLFDMH